MLKELYILSLAFTDDPETTLVILREKGGERMLPVITSSAEAMSLMAIPKSNIAPPATLSEMPLFGLIMSHYDVIIDSVCLTSLKLGRLTCEIVTAQDGIQQAFGPCFAIVGLKVAMAYHCPIFIEEEELAMQYMRKTSANSFSIELKTMNDRMLERAMQSAVDSEQYELASTLRDELRRRSALPE